MSPVTDFTLAYNNNMSSLPYHSTHTGAVVDQAVDRSQITWLQLTSRIYDGSWNIAADTDSGVVSGLGLNFVPIRGIVTVESPATGYVLIANIQFESFSYDGFIFNLSGVTDSPDYRLHFVLFGPVPETESSSGSSNS